MVAPYHSNTPSLKVHAADNTVLMLPLYGLGGAVGVFILAFCINKLSEAGFKKRE